MDLECCTPAEFPGIDYVGFSDGTVSFESLGEEGDCCG
jgi:hypothetical protein